MLRVVGTSQSHHQKLKSNQIKSQMDFQKRFPCEQHDVTKAMPTFTLPPPDPNTGFIRLADRFSSGDSERSKSMAAISDRELPLPVNGVVRGAGFFVAVALVLFTTVAAWPLVSKAVGLSREVRGAAFRFRSSSNVSSNSRQPSSAFTGSHVFHVSSKPTHLM